MGVNLGELLKNMSQDQQKQLTDLYAELVKALQPRKVVTRQGTYVVDTVPPEVVLGNILNELKEKNVPPENFYSELVSKLNETIMRINEQRAKEEEEQLNTALESVEEQRQREAELGERLDQLKTMWIRQWRVPRLIELPESPFAIPPWQGASPKPIELLGGEERRREVLA
jgi:adenylate kinase family enzyme